MQNIEKRLMQKNLKYAKKGIFFGIFGGFLCGCPFIFQNMGMSCEPLASGVIFGFLVVPIIFSFLQDIGSFVMAYITLVFHGKQKECIRSFRTKPGKMLIISSLIGGPIACTSSIISIYFAGPVYPTAISACFPALGAVLSGIFLKERINGRNWIGILCCVIGAVIVSWTPPSGDIYSNFYLGILFAVIAAIGWAVEGIIACSGMDFIDPEVAYTLSKLYAICIHLLFTLPVAGGLGLNAYKLAVQSVFSPVMLFAIIAGFVMGLGYMYYYKCNNTCGSARGMALNNTYVLWSAIIGVLFTDVAITYNFMIGLGITVFGALMVAGKVSELFNLRNIE